MGRGKVQLKRIEDNNSRQVTFTKRRNGLIKKAKELAVLCDVDLALLIFSAKGRLSEYSSGDSIKHIIDRYQLRMEEENAVRRSINPDQNPTSDFSHGHALLEMVKRQVEDENMDQLTIAELIQLELQFHDMLRQIRQRKTQVMLEALTASQEQEKQLKHKNELMQMAVAQNEDEAYVPAQAQAVASEAAELNPNSDMPPTPHSMLAFL